MIRRAGGGDCAETVMPDKLLAPSTRLLQASR
jgi:hypothetical protein